MLSYITTTFPITDEIFSFEIQSKLEMKIDSSRKWKDLKWNSACLYKFNKVVKRVVLFLKLQMIFNLNQKSRAIKLILFQVTSLTVNMHGISYAHPKSICYKYIYKTMAKR